MLKISVLVEENLIFNYKLDFKKVEFRQVQEKSKEISVDFEKDSIYVHNFFSNKEKILKIKNKMNFLPAKDTCINYSNILNSMGREEIEKIKEELITELFNKFEDELYNQELEDKILNIMDKKIDNIFSCYEKKLEDSINNFSKTMEKTMMEEKLLSLRLEKLIQFYK